MNNEKTFKNLHFSSKPTKNEHRLLSHIIQHDICRDARDNIDAAEFIAGVFE